MAGAIIESQDSRKLSQLGEHAKFSMVVAPARYVLLPLANLITGYSVKAMERKIERGDWQEGKVWRRAPDGHIMIDLQGYQRWVEDQ
jgi:hypothetical protein